MIRVTQYAIRNTYCSLFTRPLAPGPLPEARARRAGLLRDLCAAIHERECNNVAAFVGNDRAGIALVSRRNRSSRIDSEPRGCLG